MTTAIRNALLRTLGRHLRAHDLFIRWKPLHQQPLGWAPVNDGVRLNIRPFVLAADMKQKGAGLLRSKFSVKWTKDRGKEPEALRPRDQFPWFWSCNPENPLHQKDYVAPKTAVFDGVRWNDLHYTRSAKEAARRQREAEVLHGKSDTEVRTPHRSGAS